MPSGLPNSKQDSAAIELSASDAEQKAVETFTIEVSAGHRTGKAPRPESRRRKKSGRLASPAVIAVGANERVQTDPAASSQVASKSIAHHPSRAADPVVELSRHSSTPPWLVSLVVHAAVLLVLSFCTLATLQREDLALWASSAPRDEFVEEFPEVKIDPSVELASLDTELPTELEDPGLASFGDLSAEAELSEVSASASLANNDLGEMGTLFGDSGNALSDLGAGEGGATTSFFGTKSKARRVVFVIDNTGSMDYGGLETVIVELLKSVDAMDARQQFYVFFFSDQVYPLFYPQSQATFVRATKQNKQLLREWLDSVEICTGGVWQLTQAMEAAYELRPDVVYLLADGRGWDLVRARYKVEAVEKMKSVPNASGIPVHTLGMGCKQDSDRENLASVARVNSGSFREVQVSPAMVEVAKQRNRPSHDWKSGPGKVWGTKVPAVRSADPE
jgi:von Willebrand factor type A domain